MVPHWHLVHCQPAVYILWCLNKRDNITDTLNRLLPGHMIGIVRHQHDFVSFKQSIFIYPHYAESGVLGIIINVTKNMLQFKFYWWYIQHFFTCYQSYRERFKVLYLPLCLLLGDSSFLACVCWRITRLHSLAPPSEPSRIDLTVIVNENILKIKDMMIWLKTNK